MILARTYRSAGGMSSVKKSPAYITGSDVSRRMLTFTTLWNTHCLHIVAITISLFYWAEVLQRKLKRVCFWTSYQRRDVANEAERGSPVWNTTAVASWQKCFCAISTTCGRSNTVTEEDGYAFATSQARAPVQPGSYSVCQQQGQFQSIVSYRLLF